MKAVDFLMFVEDNPTFISRTCRKLRILNSEYTVTEIRGIVISAIYESKEPNKKGIYLKALNRILEEKGLVYKGKELYKPTIRSSDNDEGLIEVASFQDYNSKQSVRPEEKVNKLLENSDLTQDEVFVMALTFGLSTPKSLHGKYKKILDNIEEMYYHKILRIQEIAAIMDRSPREISSLKKTAIKKLEKNKDATR